MRIVSWLMALTGVLALAGLIVSCERDETPAATSGGSQRPAFNADDPAASGMLLTFDDEFNEASWSDDNAADGKRWCDRGINDDPGVSPANLAVKGGVLAITARRRADGSWISGTLQTVNRRAEGFAQKFGYFEANIKIPKGDGAWPAWWLISTRHFTHGEPASELDIMEDAGHTPSVWAGSIHDGRGQSERVFPPTKVDLSLAFHRFGLLWDPLSPDIVWYFDGREVGRKRKLSTTDSSPMMAILGFGIGDNGQGGPNESTPDPMHMYVDYVRIYQFPEQHPKPVAMQPVSPPSARLE